MKSLILAITATVALWLPQPVPAQTNNNVLGELAYYGLLELAGLPQPQLLYPESVIVRRVQVQRSPVYLRVPPGHAKNWSKHCGRYNACSRPVYFVDDGWYQRTYVPAYQERHHNQQKDRNDHGGKSHSKDHGKDQSKGKKEGKGRDKD